MIALDTTAIIDLFLKDVNIKKLIEEQESAIFTTRLNYHEIILGLDLESNAKHQQQYSFFEPFFRTLIILELDTLACHEASRINWFLRKKGEMIDKFDCAIAAILLRNNVHTIVTRNIKDFKKIPNLKVLPY